MFDKPMTRAFYNYQLYTSIWPLIYFVCEQVSHHWQYPPNTTVVYSYFESRGHQKRGFPDVCFFGLQYLIKRYLQGKVITQEKIDEAKEVGL